MSIKTKSEESKLEILQRAKHLKDHVSFKRVFITPDLTRKQHEIDKELGDKLKELRTNRNEEEYRIKRGKLLKKLARSGGGGISTPIVVIKDEISYRGTVNVNSVNNVHNNGIEYLNCLYVNTRSLVNNLKIDELKAYVFEFDLDIIGITETWLNEGISSSEVAMEFFYV